MIADFWMHKLLPKAGTLPLGAPVKAKPKKCSEPSKPAVPKPPPHPPTKTQRLASSSQSQLETVGALSFSSMASARLDSKKAGTALQHPKSFAEEPAYTATVGSGELPPPKKRPRTPYNHDHDDDRDHGDLTSVTRAIPRAQTSF